MAPDSIIDTSKPSAGRIYDCLLGGHHNFDVDRQVADQLLLFTPFLSKATRLQRWCLQDLAVALTEGRLFDVLIDFASGLPTNDHIHHAVLPGTTVIYSDSDPIVVEYGREILADTPNTYFFQADMRRPEELLNRSEVQTILAGRRRVALICWGCSLFLTDQELMDVAHGLYDWAAPGSCWAFNAQGADINPDDPGVIQAVRLYQRIGSPVYVRSLQQIVQLLQPWRVDEQGWTSLLAWHNLDQTMLSERDRRTFGASGGGYGGFLIK